MHKKTTAQSTVVCRSFVSKSMGDLPFGLGWLVVPQLLVYYFVEDHLVSNEWWLSMTVRLSRQRIIIYIFL